MFLHRDDIKFSEKPNKNTLSCSFAKTALIVDVFEIIFQDRFSEGCS